jgi:hypothetical protein
MRTGTRSCLRYWSLLVVTRCGTSHYAKPWLLEQQTVQRLRQRAREAGALLGSALTAELQGRLIEQLRWALDHCILIEQAKGVLMGREGISADVACRRMRSAARSSRRPVAEVAQIVVESRPWGLPRKDS